MEKGSAELRVERKVQSIQVSFTIVGSAMPWSAVPQTCPLHVVSHCGQAEASGTGDAKVLDTVTKGIYQIALHFPCFRHHVFP